MTVIVPSVDFVMVTIVVQHSILLQALNQLLAVVDIVRVVMSIDGRQCNTIVKSKFVENNTKIPSKNSKIYIIFYIFRHFDGFYILILYLWSQI